MQTEQHSVHLSSSQLPSPPTTSSPGTSPNRRARAQASLSRRFAALNSRSSARWPSLILVGLSSLAFFYVAGHRLPTGTLISAWWGIKALAAVSIAVFAKLTGK